MPDTVTNNQMQVLVCVTSQKTCELLIQEGARIAKELDGAVSVVHVADQDSAFLGSHQDGEALEHLFRASDEVGADMTVFRAKDVMDALVKIADRKNADCIVVGSGPGRDGNSFAERLRMRLPGVEVRTVFAR